MTKIVLTPRERAIRAAEKQVCALLLLYDDAELVQDIGLDDEFVASRTRSLRKLQDRLREAMAKSDMLPSAANLESAEAAFVLERLRGFLKNEPFEVPICEESKLLELCADIANHDMPLSERIAPAVENMRRAIALLRNGHR